MSTTATHDAPASAATISTGRLLYWSVQRELWEHRSLYVAPLAVAALILVGFTIGLGDLPAKLRTAAASGGMDQRALVEQPYTFAALLLMGTTFVIGMFYCLDALYGERRDRSVLFWKSLPVSDVTTVLAKACVPLFILPLLTFAVTLVTQVLMLLVASGRLVGTGLSVWSQLSFGEMTWTLFHHLVLGHGLWYAPIWGWLLFCSAWARRTPVLWATLPLLAVGLVEKIAFGTTYFGNWLGSRLMGGPTDPTPAPALDHDMSMTIVGITASTPGQLLVSPGLWIGLALTAIFLMLAVRLRHSRGPA
jgi:ABC-2 type transport system permease protein